MTNPNTLPGYVQRGKPALTPLGGTGSGHVRNANFILKRVLLETPSSVTLLVRACAMQPIRDGGNGQTRGSTRQCIREDCRRSHSRQRDGQEKFQLAGHRRNQRRPQRGRRQEKTPPHGTDRQVGHTTNHNIKLGSRHQR